MAKRTSEQAAPRPSNEIPEQVAQQETSESFEQMVTNRLNDLTVTLSEVLERTSDHELRLYHLRDKAKPIPMQIGQIIKLDMLFSNVYSQTLAAVLLRYYNPDHNEETFNSYIDMALKAAINSVERLAQRFENSHKTE